VRPYPTSSEPARRWRYQGQKRPPEGGRYKVKGLA